VNASANAIRRMFGDVSLGSPENAIGFVFWRITARYQREVDRALEPLSLTNLQFVSLALSAWFARSGDAANQAQLARFGGIHPMQLSQMLKALEAKGFVARHRSSTDSRAKEVFVSQSGLLVLKKAFPLVIQIQTKLFGDAGRPNGHLHKILVQTDRALGEIEEQ
jgi:DNA-binding MarR family transcriptional regulator